MRVAEEQVGAHAAQLLERKQPQLVKPVVHQCTAFCLRCEDRHKADEVAWKPRPQPGRNSAGPSWPRLLDAKDVVNQHALDVQSFEHGANDLDVLGPRATDVNLAARYTGHDRPAS